MFVCPHPGCNHVFLTKRGINIHAGKCQWKNEFVVEKILSHKGPITVRQPIFGEMAGRATMNSMTAGSPYPVYILRQLKTMR